MWVLIVETRGDRYVGELTNEPTAIKGLTVGDRVEFGPEHIAQTIIKRSDPRWFEAAEKHALVSAAVFEEGKSTTWMYREPVTRDEDSGWRLFTGDETEAELADASRVRICNVAWLIDFDPSLLPAIRGPVGSAFERSSAAGPWLAVTDWEPSHE